MYRSKKIGVFISHIFGAYQQGVCQGIVDRALEYGYTAEIFSDIPSCPLSFPFFSGLLPRLFLSS